VLWPRRFGRDGTADHAGDVINYTIRSPITATWTDQSGGQRSFVSNLAPVLAGGFNTGDANSDGELSVGETWQYTASHTLTRRKSTTAAWSIRPGDLQYGLGIDHQGASDRHASVRSSRTARDAGQAASVATEPPTLRAM